MYKKSPFLSKLKQKKSSKCHTAEDQKRINCRASELVAALVLPAVVELHLYRKLLDRDCFELVRIPHVGLCGPVLLVDCQWRGLRMETYLSVDITSPLSSVRIIASSLWSLLVPELWLPLVSVFRFALKSLLGSTIIAVF